jgi:hypothetical protein
VVPRADVGADGRVETDSVPALLQVAVFIDDKNATIMLRIKKKCLRKMRVGLAVNEGWNNYYCFR